MWNSRLGCLMPAGCLAHKLWILLDSHSLEAKLDLQIDTFRYFLDALAIVHPSSTSLLLIPLIR